MKGNTTVEVKRLSGSSHLGMALSNGQTSDFTSVYSVSERFRHWSFFGRFWV